MPGFLHGFARQFPHVAIELLATNEPLDIIRARIDFAFRVGPVSGQDLVIRKLSPIKRILVASPGYLRAADPVTLPDHLPKQACLVHGAHATWQFSKGGARARITPAAAIKSDSIGFLLQAAIAANGVALLPAYICAPHIAAGALVELLPRWSIPPHQMTMVSSHVKNLSRAQAAFRGYVGHYDFSPLSDGREVVS